jgi:aspartyl aminopeptidase
VSIRLLLSAALALGALALPFSTATSALAAEPGPDAATRQRADDLAKDYMRFLDAAKVPLQRTRYLKAMAEKAGFKPYTASERWRAGAKFYHINRERAMMLWVVGDAPLADGVRVIGAHLDSPRLDLRVRPLKTGEGLLMLKVEPYGGVKRYQWANLPLALVGQVARMDGRLVDVSIGLSPDDPVFILPDLAPHVDKDQRARTADQVFKGDELNAIAASLPDGSGDVKKAFLKALQDRYGLMEDDFTSAELSLVPAVPPREIGLDRALIGSYGQDDGLCSFVGARALMNLPGTPKHTAMVLLVDHEEVGNINTTGAKSRYFEAALAGMVEREAGRDKAATSITSMWERSMALSADVSQAINPNFPGTEDKETTARVGQGMTVKTMKPGFDGLPATRAKLRQLLATHRIPWQTYAYKVDGGGGGTIGTLLQELNMDVVDVGVPLLAMHGTYEVASKQDVHSLERFFTQFLVGR